MTTAQIHLSDKQTVAALQSMAVAIIDLSDSVHVTRDIAVVQAFMLLDQSISKTSKIKYYTAQINIVKNEHCHPF